jgi:PEGA domain
VRFLLVVACLWIAGVGSVSAQAEDPTVVRARELFKRGVDAYDRGVYYEALQSFQEAYSLRPHPSVRVNIANCYDKLDRPAEAIQNFEQFLGSGAGTAKQQEEVVKALESLRKRVGRLLLHVSPDGAKVVIDANDPMRAPIADVVLLKAGRHQLTVSLDRHETAMRVVDIAAGGTTELTISLARVDASAPDAVAQTPPMAAPVPPPQAAAALAPPAAAAPAVAKAPESGASADIPAGVWIAGGVTFAALLTSILTGQLALAADRDFNSDLATVRNMGLSSQQRASAWDDGIEAADRAHTFAVATDVLLSCAVVGAVLTTVLYVNGSSNEPAVRQAGSQLQLTARF